MAPTGPEVPTALTDHLLTVATRAAAAAVDLVHHRRPDSFGVDTKSSATDHVTEMDRASEALIRAIIARDRPGDVVVGEEEGGTASSAADTVTW